MRRVKRGPYELMVQLKSAVDAIAGEPAWPADPTQAQVQALADDLDALITERIEKENDLQDVRARLRTTLESGQQIMRRIDVITSGLYGVDGSQKVVFGLRPVDTARNSAGPTPQVLKLRLGDGLAAGSIQADWKRVPRAVYEVQWFADEGLERLLGSAVSTRSELLIAGLAPGTQIWVRVRALRGRKHGEWSDLATRIANV